MRMGKRRRRRMRRMRSMMSMRMRNLSNITNGHQSGFKARQRPRSVDVSLLKRMMMMMMNKQTQEWRLPARMSVRQRV